MRSYKIMALFCVFALSLFACVKGVHVEVKEAAVSAVIDISDIAPESAYAEAVIYKGNLVYVNKERETYNVIFMDLDGNELRRFALDSGRGPGEMLHPAGIVIDNDIIYMRDLFLHRVSKFDMDGSFTDSFEYNTETGDISAYDVKDGTIFFHGESKVFLGEIEASQGIVGKLCRYESERAPQVGDKVEDALLTVDPFSGDIFMGYYSMPYKIERYDSEFNKLSEYNLANTDGLSEARYIRGMNVEGDVAITAVKTDRYSVYAPRIAARLDMTDKGVSFTPFPVEIMGFKKDDPRSAIKYVNSRLSAHKGIISLIGVTDDHIVVMINGFGDAVSSLLDTGKDDWRTVAVILKK